MTRHFRVRHWLWLLPFLCLLGITYWLDQQTRPDMAKPDSAKRHDPDAVVDNFSATRLNDQGTPRFIMTAKKMQHFPDDDSSTLEMPHLTSLSAEHPAIHASAEHGILSSKGDEVFLRGNVEILREASARQGKFTLQTEYLHILPDRDFLNTDRAVTAVDAHHTVYAMGLEMDNKARTIKLLSHVRSEYVPNKE
jgi:lipopolysaccharide export system protein LptC